VLGSAAKECLVDALRPGATRVLVAESKALQAREDYCHSRTRQESSNTAASPLTNHQGLCHPLAATGDVAAAVQSNTSVVAGAERIESWDHTESEDDLACLKDAVAAHHHHHHHHHQTYHQQELHSWVTTLKDDEHDVAPLACVAWQRTYGLGTRRWTTPDFAEKHSGP
jgi:hypothetical protein